VQNRTALEESLLQSLFVCEKRQRQSCKAFIRPSIHGWRGRPFLRKNLAYMYTHPLAKRRFSIYFRPVAPQP